MVAVVVVVPTVEQTHFGTHLAVAVLQFVCKEHQLI
jgi:hypothetical protein